MAEDREAELQGLRAAQARIAAELRLRKGAAGPQASAPQTSTLVPDQGDEGFDLNIVRESDRQTIRSAVANQPATMGFLMEMAPSTIGAILGTAATSWMPIPGARVAGAAAGGAIGEALSQEAGVTPRSDVNLGLAAAGGPLGHITGHTLKLGRKFLGKAFTGLAPAKVALAKASMQKAVGEFESIGTKILAAQKGLMSMSADKLYSIARKSKIVFPAAPYMTKSAKYFETVLKELDNLKGMPEARQAKRLIMEQHQLLTTGLVSFDDILSSREVVGYALRGIRGNAKIRGVRKQFYKAVSDDLDELGKLGGRVGKMGQIAKAAASRSKLENSVKELQRGLDDFVSYETGTSSLQMNVKAARNWLRAVTTPGNKKYNKNMSDALSEFIPDIDNSMKILSAYTQTNPAGPGSLVIRGIGAATLANFGNMVGGAPMAAVGAVAGAKIPEMLLSIMVSKPAMAFLQKAAVMGRGEISGRIWAMAGQIAISGIRDSSPSAPPPEGQSQNPTRISLPMPPPVQ